MPAQSVADVRTLVALVECKKGERTSHGGAIAFELTSGISPGANLVTAAHLLSDFEPQDCLARFQSDPETSFPLRWSRDHRDEQLDLAVITSDLGRIQFESIQRSGFRVLDKRKLARDADVYPFGHPSSRRFYMPETPARIEKIAGDRILFSYRGVSEGFSGGALLTSNGLLCGMISRDLGSNVIEARSAEAILTRIASWGDFRPRWEVNPASGDASSVQTLSPLGTIFFELGETFKVNTFDDVFSSILGPAMTHFLDISARLEELTSESKRPAGKSRRDRKQAKLEIDARISDLNRLKAKAKEQAESEVSGDPELKSIGFQNLLPLAIQAERMNDAVAALQFGFDMAQTSLESMVALMNVSGSDARKTLGWAAAGEASAEKDSETLTDDQIRKLVQAYANPYQKEAYAAGEAFGSYAFESRAICELGPLEDYFSQLEARGVIMKPDDDDKKNWAAMSQFNRAIRRGTTVGRSGLVTLLSLYDLHVDNLPFVECGKSWTLAEREQVAVVRGKLQAALEARAEKRRQE